MKSIEYKLKGTRLPNGAIGKPERFTVTVSRQVGTMTPRAAMDTARQFMYEDGYDHILFLSLAIKAGKSWQNIPMLKALELE